jgi:hypothetical protein
MYNQRASVQTRLQVLNFTNEDLTVAYRQGWKFRVPKQYDPEHQSLILRLELSIPSLVEINAQRLLSVVQERCSAELGLLQASLRPKFERFETLIGGHDLVIDYSISIPEIKRYGGTVYFHEVDLLISLMDQDEAPDHPFSEEGMNSTVASDHLQPNTRFGFTIEIIDNLGKEGDRYINISGKVFKIVAKSDPRKMDGAYVSWNAGVSGRLDIPEAKAKRYDMSDADVEFKLFRTYAEAMNFGDLSQARKEELAQLEHDNLALKASLMKEKAVIEQKNLRLEADLKEVTQRYDAIKTERDMLLDKETHYQKLEELKLKDHYERRSYDRKDGSEVLKVLPAVVVGLGAVFMAVKTFFGR